MTTNRDAADLGSLRVLMDLEVALSRFSKKGHAAVAAIRSAFRRKHVVLNNREEDARREVSECADALSNAGEDDDTVYLSNALAKAEARLENIRAWQAKVLDQNAMFQRQVARFDRLIEDTVRRGRHFLEDKHGDLHAYHIVQLEHNAGTEALNLLPIDQHAPRSEERRVLALPQRMTDFRLPDGFVWVPLTQIDLKNELKELEPETGFKKVPYETMREGFNKLRDEVLPHIHQDTTPRSSDSSQKFDQAEKRDYANGFQRVYDAFFGQQDYIYLVRRKGGEQYEIINGRHRIKIAEDLGWDAIPAQIKDMNHPRP